MSVAHWGENGVGDWKIKVKTTENGHRIDFHSWRLKLFGESIDSSKTETFVFGNDKEEVEPTATESTISQYSASSTSTSTSATSTSSISIGVETSAVPQTTTASTDPDSDPNTPKN